MSVSPWDPALIVQKPVVDLEIFPGRRKGERGKGSEGIGANPGASHRDISIPGDNR